MIIKEYIGFEMPNKSIKGKKRKKAEILNDKKEKDSAKDSKPSK